MTIIWLTLFFVFAVGAAGRYYAVPSPSIPNSVRPNLHLALLASLVLIAVSGLRNNIGDTYFYMHSYQITDFSLDVLLKSKDIGFNLFQWLLKLRSDDPQILIFTTALITNLLIVIGLFKYTRLFELGLFLYITSGAYIVSMNGIRQYMAAAILFAATGCILKGRWKTYIAVVLLASLFHQSALLLIPIFFVVRRPAWTGTTMLLLGVAVLIVFGFNRFQDLLFTALQGTHYSEYQNFEEGGANVIRVIFYGLPLVVAFFAREKLRTLFPKIDVFVNLSLLGLVMLIISTQNWIFARVAIYFQLYQIVLTTWIIKAFRPKDQKLVYLTLVVLYLIYFFFENVLMLDIRYRSDYITWFT